MQSNTIDVSLQVQVDEPVKRLLSDSVAQIIFEADSVKMFSLLVKSPTDTLKMDSAQVDSITPPNFHGCYILHDYGMLSKAETYPILHILSDRDYYIPEGLNVKSPFTPNVAMAFYKGAASVDIIFSFTGGQMYVFMKNEDRLYFKYTYERLTMKYFQNYLKSEKITEYLKL